MVPNLSGRVLKDVFVHRDGYLVRVPRRGRFTTYRQLFNCFPSKGRDRLTLCLVLRLLRWFLEDDCRRNLAVGSVFHL